jgi:RNase P subunit RPR2
MSLEAQRRSFVFGNCSLENPDVTREMVDEEADRLSASDPFIDRLTAMLTILSCKGCKRVLHPGALFGNRYRDTETNCHKCLEARNHRLSLELEPYEGDGREDVEERNG